LGYEGGTDYFGRGFIQLTHLRNYQRIGQRIGMGDQLVQNPELASKPEVAAKVLAAFFKDNNVANLASSGDFVDARDPVNPDYYAYAIAKMALKYLYSIA
jgi:putative chitinase